MWYLRVQYTNKRHDIVSATMLDQLISLEKITKFYRPSEKRWVTLEVGPIRKGLHPYTGLERRRLN